MCHCRCLDTQEHCRKQTVFWEAWQRSQIQLYLLSGLATEMHISLPLDSVLHRRRFRDWDPASFTPFQPLQICSHSTVGKAGEPQRLRSPSSFLVQVLHLPLLWGYTPEKKKSNKEERRQGADFRRHLRAYMHVNFISKFHSISNQSHK